MIGGNEVDIHWIEYCRAIRMDKLRGRYLTTRPAKIKKSTIIIYGHNLHTTGRWALYA